MCNPAPEFMGAVPGPLVLAAMRCSDSHELDLLVDPLGVPSSLLVKLQDEHPVNKMICMDFQRFGPILTSGFG